MEQLPLYQCHKKVRAARVLRIEPPSVDVWRGGARLHLSGGDIVVDVDAAWLTRNPALAVGGYFVEYQEGDKYTSYSPAEPFESGYTLVE